MSVDEDGLVRAILIDPHDDLARSAYADWLKERGKPLHAKLYRGGPRNVEQERKLTGKLSQAIQTAFPDSRAGSLNISRGVLGGGILTMSMPPSAFISKKFQACAGEMLRGFHVLRVFLVGTTKDWAKVGEAPAMAGLRSLVLNSGGSAVEGVARCDGLGGLFSLAAWHLKERRLLAFAKAKTLKQLVHLDLHGLQDAADTLPSLASGPLAGQIQYLALGHSGLHGPGFAALLRAGTLLEGLTTLSLVNDSLDDTEVEALAMSRHLSGLRSLDLSGNEITDSSLKALARSPLAGRLRWVGFAYSGKFTEGCHQALAEALHPKCRVATWVSINPAEPRRMRAIYGGRWGED